MAAAANGRLLKELKEVGKNDTSGVQAKPISEGNFRHLRGTILGPEGTVYDGGVFEIDIQLPTAYPFEPPKMKFLTKIWHPNISSQTGAICLVRGTWGTDPLLSVSLDYTCLIDAVPFVLVFLCHCKYRIF